MNVAMAEPLSKSEMANFAKSTTPLLDQLKLRLATAKKLQQLALADSDSESSRKQ